MLDAGEVEAIEKCRCWVTFTLNIGIFIIGIIPVTKFAI